MSDFVPFVLEISRLPIGLWGRGYLTERLSWVAQGKLPVSSWLALALACPDVPPSLRPRLEALAAELEKKLSAPEVV